MSEDKSKDYMYNFSKNVNLQQQVLGYKKGNDALGIVLTAEIFNSEN